MSESNDSRIEAAECLRKANSCADSRDRWAWLVLAESWLMLANTQEISEKGTEAKKAESVLLQQYEVSNAQPQNAA